MSSDNPCAHSELVHLYALRSLPKAELREMEAHLNTCDDCRRELDAVRRTIESFVAWPTDVLRPSHPMWDRISERVAQDAGSTPLRPTRPPSREPEWRPVAAGIWCKVLATDLERKRVSMLVRLAPNTEYPPHRHAGVEELHLLQGVLCVDEMRLNPGDYLRSELGSSDARVYSATGCTCVLVTSTDDELG